MADDVFWLDVLPSMAGFATELAKGSTQAATAAGKTSGLAWAKSFAGAAGDAGSESVVRELDAAARKTKQVVDAQTVAIAKARGAQKDAAAKVVEAEKALADARAKGDSTKVEAAELRLAAARDRHESTALRVVATEDQLAAAQREHRTVLGQLEEATKKAEGSTESSASALDRAKQGWDTAKGSLGGLVAKMAVAAGGAALLAEAWSSAMEQEVSTDHLTARLDLTKDQSARAGEAAGALYAAAYGESMDEVASAIGSVMSSISGMSEASTSELEDVAAAALNLADLFTVDVAESARNVGIWVKEGLVADAVTGFDLLTASLQKVPEAVRGEVLDASHEYAQFFAQLGMSGEQAMGMLVKASEGGQYAVDKTGDALKELTIRATDMSASSVAAYAAAGLSADDMAARFLAGGESAGGALGDLVAGLQGIEDPTARANAAIALFGTPLEDLGTDKIPQFLASLTDTGLALEDVQGKAAEVDAQMHENAAGGIETLKRSFMSTLSDGVKPLLGPVSSFLEWARETPGVLTGVAVALGVVALAWAAMTLAASPWLAIGAAVAVVIGGIVVAVQNWGTIVDWLREKWEPVDAWFARIWQNISAAVGTAWQAVVDALGAGWDWVEDHVIDPIALALLAVRIGFATARDQVTGAWERVRSGLASGWDWIEDHVFTPLRGGVDAVGRVFDSTSTWIGQAWDRVKEAAASPVRFVVNTIYRDGIKSAWDRIADALGLSLRLPTITLPFAAGGVLTEDHAAQIAPAGAMRLWAEPETGGEAYIPLAPSKRSRSVAILEQVADRFGMRLDAFADGGFWDRVGGVVSGVGSRVRDLVGDVARVLADPATAVRDLLTAPIERLLSQVGGGVLGQMLVELPRRVIEDVVSKARDLVTGLFGGQDGAAAGWVRPSRGPVTSEYGPRWGAFHAGVDVTGGGPTYAAAAGRVVRAGWNVLPGRTGIGALLEHAGGAWTYYGHNPVDGLAVSVGDLVRAGQRVGAQGDTGNVTGVHLHFELHRGALGRTVNPRSIGVFDAGGFIPPGVSVAVNNTGRPELVLTAEQQAALTRGGLTRADLDYLADRIAATVLAGASRVTADALGATTRALAGTSQARGAVW